MERRVYATFLRQWPEQVDLTRAIVTSPELGIFEYPHPAVGTACDLICYMLGMVYPLSFITVCHQNGLLCTFMCYFMHVLLFFFFFFFNYPVVSGVVERIRDYPHKGFQVEQQLPPSVLCAYNWLLQAGYSPK